MKEGIKLEYVKKENKDYEKVIEIIETLCKHNMSTEGLIAIKKDLIRRNMEK